MVLLVPLASPHPETATHGQRTVGPATPPPLLHQPVRREHDAPVRLHRPQPPLPIRAQLQTLTQRDSLTPLKTTPFLPSRLPQSALPCLRCTGLHPDPTRRREIFEALSPSFGRIVSAKFLRNPGFPGVDRI